MTTEGGSRRVRAELRSAPAWAGWGLLGGLFLLVSALAWQWLFVRTHRLYLDDRRGADVSMPTEALQRFDLIAGRVTPQITSTRNERLSFPVDLSRASTLHLRVAPRRHATIEIGVVDRGARRVLLRRGVLEATEFALPVAATTGQIDLLNEGELMWSDPRLVEEVDFGPAFSGVLVVLCLVGVVGLRGGWLGPLTLPPGGSARDAVLGGITALLSVGLCFVLLEVGLRAMGPRLPSWITDLRRSLGEVSTDPRWQDSASYGPRLAPLVDTFCEWEQGDIVRMGFLPPDLVRHRTYRFPFVTDANGFRNSKTAPSPSVVVALGDSFTDGMTLPVHLTWPARLEHLLGVSVRNFGTAGFGPGQELRVLREYALAESPRLIVVAFFAGNDLVDAERYEAFERGGGLTPSVGRGWRIKAVITRFDHLYSSSLYQGASGLLRAGALDVTNLATAPTDDYSGEDPAAPSPADLGFERGLFTVPVAGRALRFAFLPPYLNRLTLSREELETSRGWELTRQSYREMQRLAREAAGELVVLFIPTKSQVYLPLLETSFGAAELREALRLSLGGQGPPLELSAVMRNRLALNGLMREFCAEEGIAFLDLTADLEAKVGAGQNVYFPDDSHWNAAGHETAALELAQLLGAESL